MPEGGLFSCAETPLNVSPTKLYENLQPYRSYFGKFRCPETGAMTVKIPGDQSGIMIDENTLTTFSKNGISYSQYDTRLYIPGLHNHIGGLGDAELCIFLRSLSNDIICICLPLFFDDNKGSVYFGQLNRTFNSTIVDRQSLLSVFPDKKIDGIEYRGADIRNRNKNNPQPKPFCDSIPFPVTYTLMRQPGYIKTADLQRIKDFFKISTTVNTREGPVTTVTYPNFAGPVPTIMITSSNIFTQPNSPIRLCPEILFEGKTFVPGKPKTPALKCVQVDPMKDVGPDGTINLSKAQDNIVDLTNEVSNIQNNLRMPSSDDVKSFASIDSIETIIAIVVACIIALIIISLIGYNLIKYFTRKPEVVKNIVKVGGSIIKFKKSSKLTSN